MTRCIPCVEKKLRKLLHDKNVENHQLREQRVLLKEQVKRLMEVSQHSLSEQQYLAEVGLYPDERLEGE